MKKIFFAIMLVCSLLALGAQAVHRFPLPQYMCPVYDGFAHNYINVSSSGAGNTGVAKLGGIDQVLHNPAAYLLDAGVLAFGVNAKPEVSSYDKSDDAKLSAPLPIGLIGVGKRIGSETGIAFIYSVPKSIRQEDFSVILGQGASILQRYPSYHLYQLSGNISYHRGAWHLGVNLHNQFHVLDDIIFYRTFDRVREVAYSLRPELGILYEAGIMNLGISAMPEQSLVIDTPYESYDSVLPLQVSGGARFSHQNRSLSLEAEFKQNSAMSDDYKDNLILRGGYEFRRRNNIFRLGLIRSVGAFQGHFVHPVNTTASADSTFIWDNIPTGGEIRETDQMIITAGYGFEHKYGSINVAFMQDVIGNAPMTQINLGLQVYLSTFKRKELLQ